MPARPATGRDAGKPTARPTRGAIGAGLFCLVSLFLLAAGGVPASVRADSAGAPAAGAFLLDPALAAPAAG
jgi:hypothetical protein